MCNRKYRLFALKTPLSILEIVLVKSVGMSECWNHLCIPESFNTNISGKFLIKIIYFLFSKTGFYRIIEGYWHTKYFNLTIFWWKENKNAVYSIQNVVL